MFVYQCEDSLEGIFTAIYNVYEDRHTPEETRLSLGDELLLFAEYVPVTPDLEKAEKVIRTLKRQFGEEDYYRICLALAAPDAEKAQAVYQTIAAGLAGKCRPEHMLDNLADQYVHHTFSLWRGARREYDHLRGFLRFEELGEGILYARISPKNHLLTFLMSHFADRFPAENFVIQDVGRKLWGIHPAVSAENRENGWYVAQLGEDSEAFYAMERLSNMERSEKERACQQLFGYFCQKIAIRERRNLELQRNMLPLRFREYMTEFQKNLSGMDGKPASDI
ncbi:MAG: TIGR03915 family putative DNA repair protein [Lachnospiraceae bacterium]|nr:TIGR03915 family putative DNA repair protein [Lachnospiraceae bacterium]